MRWSHSCALPLDGMTADAVLWTSGAGPDLTMFPTPLISLSYLGNKVQGV